MRESESAPPRLARVVLRATLARADRDDVSDNLDALYGVRRARSGRLSADLWYWWQALSFGLRVRAATVADRGTQALAGDLVTDVRLGMRILRRSSGFSLAVLATLGLGLGANVVVFAVVNASVLRPLPYPDADRVRWLWPEGDVSLSHEEVLLLAPALAGHAEITAFAVRSFALQGAEEARIVTGAAVTTNHFDVLGLPPVLGRAFEPEDSAPGAAPVAVLSDGVWRSQFGADPSIVGRVVDLYTAASIPMVAGAFTGAPHTVIGVLPPDYAPFGYAAEVYTPLVEDPGDPAFRAMGELSVVGRLESGATPESVAASLRRLGASGTLRSLEDAARVDSTAPLRDVLHGSLRPALGLALAAVVLVLLVASANVASLTLTRARERQSELRIRHAIGAGRGRLVRQLLTESLVLAVGAGVVAVVVAVLGLPLVVRLLPDGLVPLGGITLDGRVVLFAVGAVLTGALVSGAIPALLVGSGTVEGGESSRIVGSGRRGHRTARAFVAAQIALGLVLAHGAGLLVTSFNNLTRVDPGFTSERVISLRLAPSAERYRATEERRGLVSSVLERIAARPDIESVGAIHFLPVADGGPSINFLADPTDPEARQSSGYRVITPGYLETMDIPLVEGRGVTVGDVADGPTVGLVNRALAGRLWPGGQVLGRTVYRMSGDEWFTVVGVVENVRQAGPARPSQPEIYIPLSQTEWASAMTVVARTTGSPSTVGAQLREEVQAVDPHVPVTRVLSMDRVLSNAVARPRFFGVLFSMFAGLALALASVGVFGVVSAVVSDRTDEIGIRLALGAGPGSVLVREVRDNGRSVALGLVVGLGVALVGNRFLEGLLHEVDPMDPLHLLGAALLLGVIAALAVLLPATRAARLDPAHAIRKGG